MMRLIRTTIPFTLISLLLVIGCQKDENGPNSPGDDENPPPGDGMPLDLTLSTGTYWDFTWAWEVMTLAQGSGSTSASGGGFFRITLAEADAIGGVTAYRLAMSGKTFDGDMNFAPRCAYLAVGANGSLLGSTDGSTLQVIYDATQKTWTGGGFFIAFPGDQSVSVGTGPFPGQYNQFDALRVSREQGSGGCSYYSEIGETICTGEEWTLSEWEYYKQGIGPLGFQFQSAYTSSGGLFFSRTERRSVELVGTNLTATDGTVFNPPAWLPVASLHTPRMKHAAAVLDGRIYAIGGTGSDNNLLSSVEVYDPLADTWSPGPDLPETPSSLTAEALGGKIYVVTEGGRTLCLDPEEETWSDRMQAPFNGFMRSCTPRDDRIFIVKPEVEGWSWKLGVKFYIATDDAWWSFPAYTSTTIISDFAVANLGPDIYVTCGLGDYRTYRQTMLRFNVDTRSWDWPVGFWFQEERAYHCAVALDGQIIVLGGKNYNRVTRSVEAYTPGAHQEVVSLQPMFKPRQQFAAVVLNGKIYAIGGHSGSACLGDVEVYTPR